MVFLPSAELELAAAGPGSLPRPKREKKPTPKPVVVKTEMERSAEIIVQFIRENVPGDWGLFFEALRPGPSIQEMFERAKPESSKRRPLDQAAQVIAECKPEVLPDDHREHASICLPWFARWTQRVIPKAAWQEALEAAQKTLRPKS